MSRVFIYTAKGETYRYDNVYSVPMFREYSALMESETTVDNLDLNLPRYAENRFKYKETDQERKDYNMNSKTMLIENESRLSVGSHLSSKEGGTKSTKDGDSIVNGKYCMNSDAQHTSMPLGIHSFPVKDTNQGGITGFSVNPEEEITWISISGIYQKEILLLEKAFHLHPLTSEDIILADTREKFELFPHYCFSCICFTDKESFDLGTEAHKLFLIMMPNMLVSISMKPLSDTKTLLQRINKSVLFGIDLSPEWVCYLLVDEIVDSFIPMVRYVEVTIESIDDLSSILKSQDKSEMMLRMSKIRKKSSYLFKTLYGKNNLITNLYNYISSRQSSKSVELNHYFTDIKGFFLNVSFP